MKRSSRLLLLLSTTALFNTPSLASQPGPDDKDFSDNKSSGAHTLYSDVAVSTGPNSTTALNTSSVVTSLDPDDKDEAVSANQNMQQAKIQYDEALKKTLEEKALKNAQAVDEDDFELELIDYAFDPGAWFIYTDFRHNFPLDWWEGPSSQKWRGPLHWFPDDLHDTLITHVRLGGNRISRVPSAWLPQYLEVLDLSWNKLEELNLKANNLEVLVAQGNPKLKKIDINGMPKLLEIHINQEVEIVGAKGEHLKEEPLTNHPGRSIITIGDRKIKVIRYEAEDLKKRNPDWEKIDNDSASPAQWRFKHTPTSFSPRYEFLQAFPDDLYEDQSVTEVRLGGNRISEAPSKLLPRYLKRLDLSDNALSGTLALEADNLEVLHVEYNLGLDKININKMPNLKEVHVDQNVRISGNINKIKVIRYARYIRAEKQGLSQGLSEFPDNIANNQDTTHVFLDDNNISEVPSELLPPNLKVLYLPNNALSGTLALKAKNLKELDVTGNPSLGVIDISDLPNLLEIHAHPDTEIIIDRDKQDTIESWSGVPEDGQSSYITFDSGRTIEVKWRRY